MKWHGGDLEAETDDRHHDGHDQQRIESFAVQRRGNLTEVRRARQTVEQAQPKQRERRRHAAEQKVFQGRLGGLDVALVERREDVKREARQFERDENHQDVLGADQEHHPHNCQQDQRKVFACVRREIRFHGQQNRENRQHKEGNFDELCQRVHDQHPAKGVGVRRHDQHPQDGRHAPDAPDHPADNEANSGIQFAHRRQINRQDNERGDDHEGFRRREFEEFEVAHCKPTFLSPSNSDELKLGTITSSNRRG